MPNHSRAHDENRKILCILCMKKDKDHRILCSQMAEMIKNYLIDGLNPDDKRLPHVICTTCRNILLEYKKGDFTCTI